MYLVTGNPGKAREFSALLGASVQPLKLSLREIQGTPEEISKSKLEEAILNHDISRETEIIVDDVSFELEALYGLPGPYIKSFLEPPRGECPERGILLLSNIAQWSQNAKARAVCTIGYARGINNIKIVQGITEGIIVPPRGENGFGWDKIFQPNGRKETYAELTPEEKNLISHRATAIRELKKYLGII